ncbi:hypothetical protein HAX54_023071, partial [Datura stramonium]|nr:hypothetical protein [Datura stramonium]
EGCGVAAVGAGARGGGGRGWRVVAVFVLLCPMWSGETSIYKNMTSLSILSSFLHICMQLCTLHIHNLSSKKDYTNPHIETLAFGAVFRKASASPLMQCKVDALQRPEAIEVKKSDRFESLSAEAWRCEKQSEATLYVF